MSGCQAPSYASTWILAEKAALFCLNHSSPMPKVWPSFHPKLLPPSVLPFFVSLWTEHMLSSVDRTLAVCHIQPSDDDRGGNFMKHSGLPVPAFNVLTLHTALKKSCGAE